MLALLIVGIAIVMITMADLLQTVLGNRVGYWTSHVVRVTSHVASFRNKHRLLRKQPFGCFCIMTMLLFWYVGLWLGWTLVFASGNYIQFAHSAPVSPPPPLPWNVIAYFTGVTMFSLGLGDYTVDESQVGILILSVICTSQGVFLAIVSVSYICGLLAAVAVGKAIIIFVSLMGTSPIEIMAKFVIVSSRNMAARQYRTCGLSARPVNLPPLDDYTALASLHSSMPHMHQSISPVLKQFECFADSITSAIQDHLQNMTNFPLILTFFR